MGTIIQLFRRRHQNAFEALLSPHIEHLYRLAYRFTGQRSDAEDLVQDLLVKLFPRQHELEHIERLRPWLARTLYHHFIDQVRRNERNPVTTALAILPDSHGNSLTELSTQGDSEHAVIQRQLAAALMRLSPDHRAVISLHDIEGYTLQELEFMLDTPLGTLKSRLHRARAGLREALAMEPFSSSQRYTSERTK